jgi:hypothetical protein
VNRDVHTMKIEIEHEGACLGATGGTGRLIVRLSDYDDNKKHSADILKRLKGEGGLRRMPPPPRAAWSQENVDLYASWISEGFGP